MFKYFKQAMQEYIALQLVQSQRLLYETDADREALWLLYLAGFPDNVRQEYNCHCCKSFIKHYGGLVFLIGNEKRTMWEFPASDEFHASVIAMHDFVSQSKITDVFITHEAYMGTDKNSAMTKEGTPTVWQHLYYKLPKEMIYHGTASVDTAKGERRTAKEVFRRGLEEISLSAIDTVIELIGQNSIYRGAESLQALLAYRKLKVEFDTLPGGLQDNYCWRVGTNPDGKALVRLRNTAIGTLLLDISNNRDLDEAVGAFERIMAPSNYKRPNAIITQKMVEDAEKTIEGLGYANSLGRRFATIDDLTVNNLLFVDRQKKVETVLGDLKQSAPVSPRSFSRVEEVSADDFVKKVLPQCKSVEVFFESGHAGNLMSLIAPKDVTAQSMFKWPNGFSWSYRNAVADSIKEKVKAAGGRTEAELRCSLAWYNYDDLDLYVIEPDGNRIWFRKKISATGGNLDVDMNAGSGQTRQAVENIAWPDKQTMKEGVYEVFVNQYSRRQTIDIGFEVETDCQGQLLSFRYDKSLRDNETIQVAKFHYSKADGVKLIGSMESIGKTNTQTIWGLNTNSFHPVNIVMPSPNHWSGAGTGNAHLFFMIPEARNDETVRGFFNEFLSPELEKHKRVFEALGGRMKVEPADKQVSGLGFSMTQHTDLVVRVKGSVSRILKIKF